MHFILRMAVSTAVLFGVAYLSRGRLLSDMIALIGTMDIVLADVDR